MLFARMAHALQRDALYTVFTRASQALPSQVAAVGAAAAKAVPAVLYSSTHLPGCLSQGRAWRSSIRGPASPSSGAAPLRRTPPPAPQRRPAEPLSAAGCIPQCLSPLRMQMQAGEGEGEQPSGDIRRGPACWHMAHGSTSTRLALEATSNRQSRSAIIEAQNF